MHALPSTSSQWSPRTRSVIGFVAVYVAITLAVAFAVTHSQSIVTVRPAAPKIVTDTDGLHLAVPGAPTQGDDVERHSADHRVTPYSTSGAIPASAGRGYAADVRAVRAQGYTIEVSTNSPSALYNTTVQVARQIRAYGIRLTIVRSNATPTTGVIKVSPKTNCTGTLLGLTSRTQGGVWNNATRSWTITALYSSVGICSKITRGDALLTATVQHEMGHALGLGHYPSTFKGHSQIMKPVLSRGMQNYQSGDSSGLRYLISGIPRS